MLRQKQFPPSIMELKILKMERLQQEMPHIILSSQTLSFIFQALNQCLLVPAPTRRRMFLDSLTVLVNEHTAQSRAESRDLPSNFNWCICQPLPKCLLTAFSFYDRCLLNVIEWMKDPILPIPTLSLLPLAHSVLARSPSLYSSSRPSSCPLQPIFFCVECSHQPLHPRNPHSKPEITLLIHEPTCSLSSLPLIW